MHHVAIAVKDLVESLEFYKLFGFEKVDDCSLDEGRLSLTVIEGKHGKLELFSSLEMKDAVPSMSNLPEDLRQVGCKHFAIEVADLRSELRRLSKHGLACDTVNRSKLGFLYTFIRDPSGNWIELIDQEGL